MTIQYFSFLEELVHQMQIHIIIMQPTPLQIAHMIDLTNSQAGNLYSFRDIIVWYYRC